jgi:hypothetical protein
MGNGPARRARVGLLLSTQNTELRRGSYRADAGHDEQLIGRIPEVMCAVGVLLRLTLAEVDGLNRAADLPGRFKG